MKYKLMSLESGLRACLTALCLVCAVAARPQAIDPARAADLEQAAASLRVRIDTSSGGERSALLAKLGSILSNQERYREAEEAYSRAERSSTLPPAVAAQIRLERAAAALADESVAAPKLFREAALLFKRAGDIDSFAMAEARWIDLVRASGEWPALRAWASSTEAIWDEHRVSTLRRTARLLSEAGKAAVADELFARWLVANAPHESAPLVGLERHRLTHPTGSESPEVLAELAAASDCQSGAGQHLLFAYAMACERTNAYEEAIRAAKRVEEAEPNAVGTPFYAAELHVEAMRLRILCLGALNRWPEAQRLTGEFLKKHPGHPDGDMLRQWRRNNSGAGPIGWVGYTAMTGAGMLFAFAAIRRFRR